MSATLIDSVRSAFTPDALTKISTLLGETESNVQKAVHGAIPMILIDVLHKSHFPEPTARIGELSRQAAAGDLFGELHELSTSAGGLLPGSVLLNKGTEYAHALLLERFDPVVMEISRYSGISLPSATFITGIVTFASLDAIGRHLNQYRADAGGLSVWIQTHADSIRPATPVGLEVRHALGIPRYPWETSTVRRSRHTALYVAIVLIIVIVAGLFFYQYRKDHPMAFSTTADTITTARSSMDTIPASSSAAVTDTARTR